MAAAVGYRFISRDTPGGAVTGTFFYWAVKEDPTRIGADPFVGAGVVCEPGTTVSTPFWISPNVEKLAFCTEPRTPSWGLAIVTYDDGDILETINNGNTGGTIGPTSDPINPQVRLVTYKISAGDIVDEFSAVEIKRLAVWADSTPAGQLSAEDILAAHSVSEVGPLV